MNFIKLGVAGFASLALLVSPSFALLDLRSTQLFGLQRPDPKNGLGWDVVVLLLSGQRGLCFLYLDGTSVREFCVTLLACLVNDLTPVWAAISSSSERICNILLHWRFFHNVVVDETHSRAVRFDNDHHRCCEHAEVASTVWNAASESLGSGLWVWPQWSSHGNRRQIYGSFGRRFKEQNGHFGSSLQSRYSAGNHEESVEATLELPDVDPLVGFVDGAAACVGVRADRQVNESAKGS